VKSIYSGYDTTLENKNKGVIAAKKMVIAAIVLSFLGNGLFLFFTLL
jgi:hypothetical protein